MWLEPLKPALTLGVFLASREERVKLGWDHQQQGLQIIIITTTTTHFHEHIPCARCVILTTCPRE